MTCARRCVVALLLPLLVGCGQATSRTTASPRSALPAGYPAEAFRVAIPLLFYGSGGPPPDLPACKPTQVVAKAATIRTTDGVDGVIELDGPHCSLDIRQGPTYLLDQAGHQLGITLYPVPPPDNPPMSRGGGFALAVGHVLWGFAIDGSWCGSAPASMVVQLTTDPATAAVTDIKAPLTGPVPTCTGRSDAELRPGVPGSGASDNSPAKAVLPAPQEWSGLTLSLHVASVTPGGDLVGSAATISNPTRSAISLSPCPSYEVVVTEGNGRSVGDGTFGCSAPRVLAAGDSATYPIDGHGFGEGDPDIKPGGPVRVELAIAGVPTATATLHVG